MISKGFLAYRLRKSRDTHCNSNKINNAILFLGVAILIFALIFMVFNFVHADSIVMVWLPFMIAGVVLVLMSQLTGHFFNKVNPKRSINPFQEVLLNKKYFKVYG